MKSSTTRRSRVQDALAKTDLDFTFFTATDSSRQNFQHVHRANNALTLKRKAYHLTLGEIACFSSHLRVWECCAQQNERYLVLEDNVELADTLAAKTIKEFTEKIPPLEYVKLAALRNRRFKCVSSVTDTHSLIRYSKRSSGTSAYLISPAGAKKLIEGAGEFLEPVDDYMEKPWRHKVIAYSIYPSVFRRAQVVSTIGSVRKQKVRRTLWGKLFIECFRLYESVMYRLYFLR